jgi:hypothetical protein
MLYIDRDEQEAITLTFERNFALLIKHVNKKKISLAEASQQAEKLVKEVQGLNHCRCLDDDLVEKMETIASAAEKYRVDYLESSTCQDHHNYAIAA